MTLDPADLEADLDLLEDIEKATLRMVTQAIVDFRDAANQIFIEEQDLVQDIGEDISREALDRLGTSAIPVRLFGKIDYKRARYLFHPEFSIRQALFVDSKAEKIAGATSATIQTAQTSMRIRQIRQGSATDFSGTLPKIILRDGERFLTTTVFVKYNYEELANGKNTLASITTAGLPNGMLQDRYNPNADDSFWLVGRDAPSLGEAFRARIGFNKLKKKTRWRVQTIQPDASSPFGWDE